MLSNHKNLPLRDFDMALSPCWGSDETLIKLCACSRDLENSGLAAL